MNSIAVDIDTLVENAFGFRRQDTWIKRRWDNQRLENTARFVKIGDSRIDEFRRISIGGFLIIIRIKRGLARHRHDSASFDIHNNYSTGIGLIIGYRFCQFLLDKILNRTVDGQDIARAILRISLTQHTDHPAESVFLTDNIALFACQFRVIVSLDTIIADTVSIDKTEQLRG